MAPTSTTASAPAVPAVIDHVFQAELSRFIAGETQGFSIDPDWKEIIGQQGINEIANRFSEFLKGAVRVHQNGGRIVMNPSAGLKYSNGKGEEAPTKANAGRIPRPPNAFILYRQHHHDSVKKEHPDYHNTVISQVIGAQWQNESAEVKEYFKKLATFIKRKHAETFPDYSYKPRKSSDKKRRMTPKKAAKLDSLAQALCAKSDTPKADEAQDMGTTNPRINPPSAQVQEMGNTNPYTSSTTPTKASSSQVQEMGNNNPHVNPTTPTEDSSAEVYPSQESTEVQHLNDEDLFTDYENWDDLPALDSGFVLGDPGFAPITVEAMAEVHNDEVDDTAFNLNQGQPQHNFTEFINSQANNMFGNDMAMFDNNMGWNGFEGSLQALDLRLGNDFSRLFAESDNMFPGYEDPYDLQNKFSSPSLEYMRQEELLSPFFGGN